MSTELRHDVLEAEVRAHPFPLVFATVSGAHLYGFASPDSDYDLRGAHVLPLRDVVGLEPGRETIETSRMREGIEVDLVTHDVGKFFRLCLRKNGYVLEQLVSPLVVSTSSEHQELVALVPRLVTKHHAHHYLGFAATQWGLFLKEAPRRVKPLLYVYRVLLTGIHLMRTGTVQANLPLLNEEYRLPQVPGLIARKTEGSEAQALALDGADVTFHAGEYARLRALLEEESRRSSLPDAPFGRGDLDDLLVRIRLRG